MDLLWFYDMLIASGADSLSAGYAVSVLGTIIHGVGVYFIYRGFYALIKEIM